MSEMDMSHHSQIAQVLHGIIPLLFVMGFLTGYETPIDTKPSLCIIPKCSFPLSFSLWILITSACYTWVKRRIRQATDSILFRPDSWIDDDDDDDGSYREEIYSLIMSSKPWRRSATPHSQSSDLVNRYRMLFCWKYNTIWQPLNYFHNTIGPINYTGW